jgi:outer membrane receptor protein involved in Fe transport
MDLLRMTPLLKVTDNAISIIGKSNVRIMINGKISYLDSSDIIQYLKSLQSDDVISIEVITTPPAKYEAGGNGGMINIITRNRKDIGLDGNVGVSYTQRSYAGISSNASVKYNIR